MANDTRAALSNTLKGAGLFIRPSLSEPAAWARSSALPPKPLSTPPGSPFLISWPRSVLDLRAGEHPAADVIIDFSKHRNLRCRRRLCERTGAALVSGTTGYTPEQIDRLRELGQNATFMHSGNYSIGIAALRHLVAQATRELPGFDCEIVETHHKQKIDAPQRHRQAVLDAVVEAEPEAGYHPVYGREGMCGVRDPKEIGMHSLRSSSVAGVHEVSFFGQDEEVTLSHRATSRQIFVNGALAAAQGLVVRDPGFYTFDQVMFA